MRLRHFLIILSLASVGVIGSGCATAKPHHNGRTGFFERLSKGDAGRKPASRVAGVEDSSQVEWTQKARKEVSGWRWPLKQVQITSPFGQRGQQSHEGIDLRARVGTPVFAAEEGKVLYAGRRISGYGKMVVLRHPGGLSTIYAHNSQLIVRKGQKVKKGQKIAISGNSGQSRGPHLHFEIRHGVNAVDPLKLLPPAFPDKTLAQVQEISLRRED